MNGSAADVLRRSADLLDQEDRSGALALLAEVLAAFGDLPRRGQQAGTAPGLAGLPLEVAEAARAVHAEAFSLTLRAAFPSLELTPEQAEPLRSRLGSLWWGAGHLGEAADWRQAARELAQQAREAGEGVPALTTLRKHTERLGRLAGAAPD